MGIFAPKMDQEPEYWDYEDDYDPRDDPAVRIEMATSCLLSCIKDLTFEANKDAMLFRGALPEIHEAYTALGLILMKFPNLLPKAAE